MPGNTYASIKHPRAYRRLRAKGYSKERAARIANALAAGTIRRRRRRR